MTEIKPPYDELDTILNEYVDNYEFNFDEGSHTPTEFEMTLIKDAIYGLLADTDWDNAWGRHIAALAKSQPVEQGEPVRPMSDEPRYTVDQIADAACHAEVNDSKFESMCVYLGGIKGATA